MRENLIIGGIAYVTLFLTILVYYLIRAGYIKKPRKKNLSKVEMLVLKEKEEKEAKQIKDDIKNNTLKHLTEVKFLMYNFDLDWHYLYVKPLIVTYAFLDSTIIISTFEIIMYLKWNMIVSLVFGFALLLGLIYSLYSFLGKILIMKGYKQNEHK